MNITCKTVTVICELHWDDGRIQVTECDVITVNDWRKTPFGMIDFGWTWFGPQRFIELQPAHVKRNIFVRIWEWL